MCIIPTHPQKWQCQTVTRVTSHTPMVNSYGVLSTLFLSQDWWSSLITSVVQTKKVLSKIELCRFSITRIWLYVPFRWVFNSHVVSWLFFCWSSTHCFGSFFFSNFLLNYLYVHLGLSPKIDTEQSYKLCWFKILETAKTLLQCGCFMKVKLLESRFLTALCQHNRTSLSFLASVSGCALKW